MSYNHENIELGAIVLTGVHNPSETDWAYQTAIPETLKPPGKRKAAPGTDEILCGFPEENPDTSSSNACDDASKNEETLYGFAWRMDCRQDTKLEDEDETDER